MSGRRKGSWRERQERDPYVLQARREGWRSRAVYKLELERLKHQRSILRSKLADEAWQALVGTGLESLVAFHRGGWKPEHLANFLRLAQAAALIAIAD